MSLILDAINKADRERQNLGTVPDLGTVHGSAAESFAKSKPLVILVSVLGVLVILLLVVVVWALSRGATSPVTVADVREPSVAQPFVETEAHSQQAIAGSSVAAKPLSDLRSDDTPGAAASRDPSPPSQRVADLYRTEVQDTAMRIVEPEVRPATVVEPAAPRPSSVDEALAQRLWEETQRQMPARPVKSTREKDDVASMEAGLESVLDAPYEQTLAAYDDYDFLHELPVRVQNTIPTIMYALHNFEQGTVVINKKTFSTGDSIATGLVIENILADGLLLNINGQAFKLSALNSWVNY